MWHTVECLAEVQDCNIMLLLLVKGWGDYAEAFDKVPHSRLLHKMDYYGVRKSTLHWIRNFLLNRTQSVVLVGHTSDPLDVVSGVPQGTVMGPLLFLAYKNDLLEATIFADDSLLIRRIRSKKDSDTLQKDLAALEEARHDGVDVAGWTVDRTFRLRFPAYPHRMWALWWQGGKRRFRTSRYPCRE